MPQRDLGAGVFGANLTPDDATGLGRWSDGQVTRSILDGIDQDGLPLCGPDHVYGRRGMSGFEAASIALFLRTLPAVSRVDSLKVSQCRSREPVAPDLAGTDDAGTP